MYWMKARSIPKYEAPFQKVRLHLSATIEVVPKLRCDSASWLMLLISTCPCVRHVITPVQTDPFLRSISAASKILGLTRSGTGKTKIAMNSTIDHALWFYDNDFDFADWLLYVVSISYLLFYCQCH